MPIYAVGIIDGYLPKKGATGEDALKKLASISGGRAFFPRSASEMNEAFERIAVELRHQYSIGYRPSNFVSDGKWHLLKIKVTAHNRESRIVVRSRAGYYALTRPR